ncbi:MULTISPECIES: glycoside hydrolase family 16 protein [Micromonospora]|uniref:Glycosyl hydrolases family 16 n=1 Tax=Micromonospora yangpuensis TaxID=683228 RepID=A0A1C6UWN5_9ACTN|nr:glycoside hydrolase family 16 protein [Micromonospora yangpuensis]GGM25139.1 hypothetical protein GCM10012279_49460 [Micromonospora yangpuensis]SCL58457.1 Glycosyl hydrolases family 16 [Micromonospora yangpuensis]
MTAGGSDRIGAAATAAVVGLTLLYGPDPSRAALPADCGRVGGDWPVVFADDFDGPALGPNWSVYTGQPSSDPRTRWHRDQVAVRDGALVLSGRPRLDEPGRWHTGGVSNWRQARTYGRWDIRFRAPASPVLSYHFLLWPSSERWPPEIDIAEGFTATRQRAEAFVHWRDPQDGGRRKTQFTAVADYTRWHTVSVLWTPEVVCWSLDGTPFGAVTGDAVPHEPMWLALQTETQVGGTATEGDHRVEIDQVRISAPSPTDPPPPTTPGPEPAPAARRPGQPSPAADPPTNRS